MRASLSYPFLRPTSRNCLRERATIECLRFFIEGDLVKYSLQV